jgi:hypothetical protein
MKAIKVLALVVVSIVALAGAFVAGARFQNSHRDAQMRAEGSSGASRMVAILRHVQSGGESCMTALERELDNALIRTGYGQGLPTELSPMSRAYLREAAVYRREHPYHSSHSYAGYIKNVLDLAERQP